MTHSPAEWAGFLSLGVSAAATIAAPFLLLVEAERWAWPDFGRLGERVLVETLRLRQDIDRARRALVSLLLTVADRLNPETGDEDDEPDIADEVSLADTGRPWRRYPTERAA